jgi:DNA-directed RNA polymerase specialized sigma24 family protein
MSMVEAPNRDQAAFRALFEEHRTALEAHCYRMLGSLQDAEDALQETMVKAWLALPAFEGRSALSTVATTLGITVASANSALNRARRRFSERRPARSQ